MFYLLTTNKTKKNNNSYIVGDKLIKKVDLILEYQNFKNSKQNFINLDSKNNNN